MSEQSQVKVKLPSGKTIDVPYEASTTVKQIKAEIHESQPDIAKRDLGTYSFREAVGRYRFG